MTLSSESKLITVVNSTSSPTVAPQQFDRSVAGDVLRLDARKDHRVEQPLIGVGVFGRRVAVPDPLDHGWIVSVCVEHASAGRRHCRLMRQALSFFATANMQKQRESRWERHACRIPALSSSTPTGCRSGSARPACRSSMPPGICRRRSATRSAEYEAAHIPGAVFFDQDAVVDPDSNLPHTLPRRRIFARHVGSMGISADDTIVVYDGPGVFSAPRVWWMFRVMGVCQVYLLDGGFDRWKAEGRPVTAEPTKIAPNVFHADFDAAPRRLARRHARHRRDAARARSPTRGRPAASPAPIRSRGRACAAATCRARRACRRSSLSQRRQAAAAGRACAALRAGRHRPVEAGRHVLRLGRHGGGRSRWRWRRLATRTTSSTTARGANGAGAPTRRS